jgi:hypothetical protein
MSLIETAVLGAVARHAQRDVPVLFHWLRLEHDLDLTPLELVLLALEIDEATGVEVAPEDLALAGTVGELVSLFVHAKNQKNHSDSAHRVA